MRLRDMGQRAAHTWPYLLVSALCVGVDQWTKWLCVTYLKEIESVTLIPGLLRLTYLENRGAAFGSLSDHRWVFMILSTVAIVAVTLYLLCFSERSRLLCFSLALIVGGGIGNMIDRVAQGFVVDFIDFYGIWSYIFNGADSFVCVGAGLLVLYYILSLKDEMKGKTDRTVTEDGGGGEV